MGAKDLKLVCVQPDDNYYTWQVISWLNSARKFGYSDKCQILLFKSKDRREWNKEWEKVKELFPEAQFFYYEDKWKGNIVSFYIPLLRPYTLMEHFKAFPELKESTIFYHDCDIILTDKIAFEDYMDDKCYLSDARSYTNATYFLSKVNDVKPHLKELYDKRDILSEMAFLVGITRGMMEENNENSGGAQYILNGIDNSFWEEMIDDCRKIYAYLGTINDAFFESENKGFQRWCTDMFCLMWGLWRRGIKTEIAKELDFAWSTDVIERLKEVKILHNAGITSDSKLKVRYNGQEVECPVFYKGKYVNNITSPFHDAEYTYNILNNEVTKKYCNHYYLSELMRCKDKYNIA